MIRQASNFLYYNHTIIKFIANVLIFNSGNKKSVIIYSLSRGRQNIFLTIFTTKIIVKCATIILNNG